MTRTLWTLALAVLAAGCFSLNPEPGQVPCGPEGECPGDFECRSDDRCYPPGGVPCAPDSCGEHATCDDTSGEPVCTCDAGYRPEGAGCVDLDECADGSDDCHGDATCTNTDGSFTCECLPGFEGDGRDCVDRDECAAGELACGANAHCVNDPGSAHCECDSGFEGDPDAGCTDIDECAAAVCSPLAFCTNLVGGFDCVCRGGYRDENGDGTSCVKSGDGHVVMNGHDMFARNLDVDRIAGNSVMLANTPGPIEVLAYHQFADPFPGGEPDNTDAAIQDRAAELGRTVNITRLDDAGQLFTALAGKHVFLVYEQEGGSVASNASPWAPILHEFVNAGGVVIVHTFFDDGWLLLQRTQLLTCQNATNFFADQPCSVVDLAHPIVADVQPSYIGTDGTGSRPCTDGVVVTTDQAGVPIVVHKVHTRPITGHSVLIGHDLFERGAGVDRVVGNSIFLANTQGSVQVLAYTQFADQSPGGEVANTNGAIVQRAAELGRAVDITNVADSAQIPGQLDGKNVLLVYEQELTSIDMMRSVAIGLAPVLSDFVRRGGVIVVMEHNGGSGGTWEFANSSGILTVTGVTGVFGTNAEIVDPLHPIALDVASPYPATNGSVTFNGADPLAVVVSHDPATSLPYVLHRSQF